MARYPLQLHTHLQRWFDNIKTIDAFAREIDVPPHVAKAQKDQLDALANNNDSLDLVARKFISH